jgi:Ser/Thr protein kinase RdoA (MazF antagonist)
MLFRDKQVVAVIDYDAARLQQRVIDFANGALQFSIIGGGEDPSQWPDHVDMSRFKRFMRGYDAVNVVSVAEVKAVPYLMCEAAIAEAVLPIAATGSFGRMEGFPFLQMIDRKCRWILEHMDELGAVLEE